MKKGIKILFANILFVLGFTTVTAQQVRINLDKDSILIGDHVTLSVEAQVPVDNEVFFPDFGDTLGLFDVVEMLPLDTLDDKIIQDIIITQFDSGYYQLGGLPALFVDGQNKMDTIYSSNSVFLYVNTVPVDTSATIMPIKPVREVPYTWNDVKKYVYIAGGVILFVIACILALVFWLRSQKPKPAPQKSMLDFYQEARKQLNILEKKQLWQKGDVKEYYLEVSEITRTYLEGRFGINAMESTTDEIIEDLYFQESLKNKLKGILMQADLAKFAKFQPEGDENIRILKAARDFVAHTKPKNLTEDERVAK